MSNNLSDWICGPIWIVIRFFVGFGLFWIVVESNHKKHYTPNPSVKVIVGFPNVNSTTREKPVLLVILWHSAVISSSQIVKYYFHRYLPKIEPWSHLQKQIENLVSQLTNANFFTPCHWEIQAKNKDLTTGNLNFKAS